MLKLSHHITGVLLLRIYDLESNDCNQDNSAFKLAKLQYSALLEDLDTACYFLECQDTKFELKKTH